jgi:hypothetical protein
MSSSSSTSRSYYADPSVGNGSIALTTTSVADIEKLASQHHAIRSVVIPTQRQQPQQPLIFNPVVREPTIFQNIAAAVPTGPVLNDAAYLVEMKARIENARKELEEYEESLMRKRIKLDQERFAIEESSKLMLLEYVEKSEIQYKAEMDQLNQELRDRWQRTKALLLKELQEREGEIRDKYVARKREFVRSLQLEHLFVELPQQEDDIPAPEVSSNDIRTLNEEDGGFDTEQEEDANSFEGFSEPEEFVRKRSSSSTAASRHPSKLQRSSSLRAAPIETHNNTSPSIASSKKIRAISSTPPEVIPIEISVSSEQVSALKSSHQKARYNSNSTTSSSEDDAEQYQERQKIPTKTRQTPSRAAKVRHAILKKVKSEKTQEREKQRLEKQDPEEEEDSAKKPRRFMTRSPSPLTEEEEESGEEENDESERDAEDEKAESSRALPNQVSHTNCDCLKIAWNHERPRSPLPNETFEVGQSRVALFREGIIATVQDFDHKRIWIDEDIEVDADDSVSLSEAKIREVPLVDVKVLPTRYDACVFCEDPGDDVHTVLCDGCDIAAHIYCLKPKLKNIPAGKWFCSLCIDERKKWMIDDNEEAGVGVGKENEVKVVEKTSNSLDTISDKEEQDGNDELKFNTVVGAKKQDKVEQIKLVEGVEGDENQDVEEQIKVSKKPPSVENAEYEGTVEELNVAENFHSLETVVNVKDKIEETKPDDDTSDLREK